MSDSRIKLRLGTRGSLLAKAQSSQIAEVVRRVANVDVELIEIKTTGDRITDKPLHEFGGKGLFTKEIEQALLDNQIDFAVHSLKDVPVTMPLVDQSDLIIAAIPAREDARDILASPHSQSLGGLALRAKVGTSSLRRKCQLLALRPDLDIQMIRGNIDTRIRKLKAGEFDAIILALAGVKRAGLFDQTLMHPIDESEMLPAPGQALSPFNAAEATRERSRSSPSSMIQTRLPAPNSNATSFGNSTAIATPQSPLTQELNQTSPSHPRLAPVTAGCPSSAQASSPLAEASSALLSVLQQLRAAGATELLNSGTL